MQTQESIQISQSEWEVMRVLWDAGKPLTAAEVIQALDGVAAWKPKTVRTFLNRLVAKNAVAAEKLTVAGYEFLHYSSKLDEQTTVRAERNTFLGRFFGGTVQSMLASCIQSGDISKDELREIRKLIDEEVGKEES